MTACNLLLFQFHLLSLTTIFFRATPKDVGHVCIYYFASPTHAVSIKQQQNVLRTTWKLLECNRRQHTQPLKNLICVCSTHFTKLWWKGLSCVACHQRCHRSLSTVISKTCTITLHYLPHLLRKCKLAGRNIAFSQSKCFLTAEK